MPKLKAYQLTRVTDKRREDTINLKLSKTIFHINLKTKSLTIGDLTIKFLDHTADRKVKDYLNLMFQNSLIPVINYRQGYLKLNTTLTDHILNNDFVNADSSTVIVKSDISNHCPIFQATSAHFFNKSKIR